MPKPRSTTVAAYIAAAPKAGQPLLRELRALLRAVAPRAEETIKWNHPAYVQGRILFSFMACKAHVNFMPTGSSLAPFKKELAKYTTGEHTIRLPYDQPLPKALIRRIATYRLKDVRESDARWMPK